MFHRKIARRNLSVQHMLVWTMCLWNMLGYSYEGTHNIRSRPCGVLCHWWWRMWHIEDKQAFPQTKIWGKPTFVFSSCLWKNHSVIVFLSIWITVVWEDFLAFSIIVLFSVKGIPGHRQTLLREMFIEWLMMVFNDFGFHKNMVFAVLDISA